MEKILQGLQGVVCLMDDILIFGKDEAQHWARVDAVLSRIKESGLTLKKEKCEFAMKEVCFFGSLG